jgi:hypothetical protein
MNKTPIQEIEESIQESKGVVEFAEALERLQKNRDFKKVILDGYFTQEAIRLVHLKADPAFQTPDRQQSIITQIDAIGALHQYFQTMKYLSAQAQKAIEAANEVRDELLAEEGIE